MRATLWSIVAFLPILLSELETAANVSFWSGVVFAVGALASAIMAPLWGSLADRYGKRPMLVRAGSVLVIGYALIGFATNHLHIFWLKAFIGALSGYIPAATMLVASTTPNDELGFAMGLLQTTIAIGTVSDPLLGAAFVSAFGLSGAFIACAALPVVATLIAVFIVKEETIRTTERTGIIKGMKNAISLPILQILFAVLVLMQAGTACTRPTLPLLIKELSPDSAAFATSVIAALFGLATAVAAPVVGRYWRGNYIAMLRDSLLALVVFMILQGFSGSVYSLGVFRFLSGIPSVAMTVAINVLVAHAATPEVRGTVFGVMNSMSSAGFVLGPLLGGYLGSAFGVASSFMGASVLYGCSGVIVVSSYKFLMDTLADKMIILPPLRLRQKLSRRIRQRFVARRTPRSM
jgi:DHA1 family multidrug resistance protein-like MFS transporter